MQFHCTQSSETLTNPNAASNVPQSPFQKKSDTEKNELFIAPLIAYLEVVTTPEARRVQEFIRSELCVS